MKKRHILSHVIKMKTGPIYESPSCASINVGNYESIEMNIYKKGINTPVVSIFNNDHTYYMEYDTDLLEDYEDTSDIRKVPEKVGTYGHLCNYTRKRLYTILLCFAHSKNKTMNCIPVDIIRSKIFAYIGEITFLGYRDNMFKDSSMVYASSLYINVGIKDEEGSLSIGLQSFTPAHNKKTEAIFKWIVPEVELEEDGLNTILTTYKICLYASIKVPSRQIIPKKNIEWIVSSKPMHTLTSVVESGGYTEYNTKVYYLDWLIDHGRCLNSDAIRFHTRHIIIQLNASNFGVIEKFLTELDKFIVYDIIFIAARHPKEYLEKTEWGSIDRVTKIKVLSRLGKIWKNELSMEHVMSDDSFSMLQKRKMGNIDQHVYEMTPFT